MEDQIRRLESAVKSYHILWWAFLAGSGTYAVLTYVMSAFKESSGGGSTIDVQWETALILFIVCDALISFVLSLQFPSESRLKKILLRRDQGQVNAPLAGKVRGTAPQPTFLGTLMLGAIFSEGISVAGLLLAYIGVGHQSQTMITLGYGLIFSGTIALCFNRWRTNRLVARVLKELPTKTGKKI